MASVSFTSTVATIAPARNAARTRARSGSGASFVSEKLSSLEGVISTATHFRLKTYKENGFLFESEPATERFAVSP